jgi:hypothetical protein
MTNAELIAEAKDLAARSGPIESQLLRALAGRLQHYEDFEQMERELDAECEIERSIPFGEAPGDKLINEERFARNSAGMEIPMVAQTWKRDGEIHFVYRIEWQGEKTGWKHAITGILPFAPPDCLDDECKEGDCTDQCKIES